MTASDKLQSEMFENPDTFGSVLLLLVLRRYGEEIFQLGPDPMTLILNLEDDLKVKIPEDNENKLKAILLATETGIMQHDPEAFRAVCITLWHGDPQIAYTEPLTLAEAIWGMFEVKVCHGELALSPGIQDLIDGISENELQDPGEHENVYGHAVAGVQERYKLWQGQMTDLGIPPMDLPALDTD